MSQPSQIRGRIKVEDDRHMRSISGLSTEVHPKLALAIGDVPPGPPLLPPRHCYHRHCRFYQWPLNQCIHVRVSRKSHAKPAHLNLPGAAHGNVSADGAPRAGVHRAELPRVDTDQGPGPQRRHAAGLQGVRRRPILGVQTLASLSHHPVYFMQRISDGIYRVPR